MSLTNVSEKVSGPKVDCGPKDDCASELDSVSSSPLPSPAVFSAAEASPRYATYFSKLFQLLIDVTVSDANQKRLTAEEGATRAVEIILAASQAGGKVMSIGNGGSAAIASHQALDLWKSAGVKAQAFNDAAQLTCLGNDFGYEQVFSKAVEMFSQAGDVLIAISSSGQSPNILNAVRAAREKGCTVITYSGFSKDCPLKSQGDLNFYVDCDQYGLVEVAHMALVHHLTDMLSEERQKAAK